MKKKILTVLIPVVATTLVILGCGKGKDINNYNNYNSTIS